MTDYSKICLVLDDRLGKSVGKFLDDTPEETLNEIFEDNKCMFCYLMSLVMFLFMEGKIVLKKDDDGKD